MRSAGEFAFLESPPFFTDRILGRSPCALRLRNPLVISVQAFFLNAMSACASDDVLIVNDQFRKNQREQNTSTAAAPIVRDQKVLAQLLRDGVESLVVQHYERYDDRVRQLCESLSADLETYVHAVVFFTPSVGQATEIHWDQMDVFAVQLHGRKQWDVYRPHEVLPNIRIPRPKSSLKRGDLSHYGTYTLLPGDVLYLPRGWIHEVRNVEQEPSLHVSFVAYMNSALTIAANAVNCAFVSLRSDPMWREAVTRTGLASGKHDALLSEMRVQLMGLLTEQLTGDLTRHFDHVPFGPKEREQLEQARQSVSLAEEDVKRLRFVRTGLTATWRECRGSNATLVSTDGYQFHPISSQLWEIFRHRQDVVLDELNLPTGIREAELSDAVEVLVSKIGLFQLFNG